MSRLISFLWTWGPSLLMMAIIFGFSSITGSQMPGFGLADWLVKKGGHATGYALLALANLYGVRRQTAQSPEAPVRTRHFALALLMAVLYAATDEFHQSFVAGRHPLLSDVGIDTLGACIGLGLWGLAHARKASRRM